MTVTDSSGTVVLTGPTGGLGLALIEPIARRRPERLVLLGRSTSALQGLAQQALEAGARAVSVVEADLSDLDAVARAGDQISDEAARTRAPITGLLLNAGIQLTDRRHTNAQGLELTFAVNVIAQHLLLRSTLEATAPGARAVLVSSGTHKGDWHSYGLVPAPRWQDPALLARPALAGTADEPNTGGRTYATSKLALVHLAHAWHRRHGDRLRINAFDPAMMPGTGLGRDLPRASLWAWNHLMPAMTFLPGWSTPRRSANHLTALALGDVHPDLSGGYVELGQVRRSSPESYDTAREQQLWEYLEGLSARPRSHQSQH